MASRIRERIGAIESSLSVFAQNWRNRTRSQQTSQQSSPSTSTTTNLDTLEVSVEISNPSNVEQENSTQDSLSNACKFYSSPLFYAFSN